jgi:hypothetical protein
VISHPRGIDPASLTPERNPRLHGLYQYWLSVRTERQLVSKAAFDPFNIRQWLGNISIYQRQGDDYIIRLDGTEIVRMTGEDWTGRTISDLDKKYGLRLGESIAIAAIERRAVFHPVRRLAARPHLTAARLLLPVSADDTSITHIVMALIPNPQDTTG